MLKFFNHGNGKNFKFFLFWKKRSYVGKTFTEFIYWLYNIKSNKGFKNELQKWRKKLRIFGVHKFAASLQMGWVKPSHIKRDAPRMV